MNRDSEHYHESRLGQVHSVHTHGPWLRACCGGTTPRPAVSWRALAPYRGPPLGRVMIMLGRIVAVVWRMGAVSQVMFCASCRASYRQVRRRVARLQRCIVALPPPCRACLAIQPSSQAFACHDTTDCIMTHSPAARPPSCHDTTILS